MRKIKLVVRNGFVVMAVLVLFLATNLGAFTPGTAGPSFLRIGVGARPSGMGEAFTAGSDDVSSMPWNPSGLALVETPQATFMHLNFLGDTSYEALSYAQPFGPGSMGGSFLFLNVPEFDNTSGLEPSVSSGDYALSVSYGGKLGYLHPFRNDFDNLLVGGTVKWVGTAISGVSAFNYLALDLGGSYKTQFKGVNVGLSLLNLGFPVTAPGVSNALPFMARLGGAYEWDSGTSVADLIQTLDGTTYLNLGTEVWWERKLALRTGYKIGGPAVGGFKGLTFGAGWQFNTFRLDYAFVPYGDLGGAHRFSGTLAFNGDLEVGTARAGSAEEQMKLGMVYYDGGFLSDAINVWQKILAEKPNWIKLKEWIDRAEGELKEEKTTKEISDLLDQGDKLFQDTKYEEAIALWQKAKALNPRLLSVERRILKAQQLLNKATESVEDHAKRAQAALADGDYNKALFEWQWVLAAHPENTEAQQAVESIKQERQTKETKLFLEAAIALQKDDIYTAGKSWLAVLKMEPDSADAKAKIAEYGARIQEESGLLARQAYDLYTHGDAQTAIELWQKALDIDPNNDRIKTQLEDAKSKIK